MKTKSIGIVSIILITSLISSCCKGSFEIPKIAFWAFVSNVDDASISIIDASNNSVVKDIDGSNLGISFSEPRNLKVSHNGKMLYVPCRNSDDVLIIDVDSLRLMSVVEDTSFYEPYAVAFTSDDSEAWVVNKQGGGSSSGSISIINTASKQVVKNLQDANMSSPEGIAIANGKAYIANRGDGSVSIYNTSSRTFISSISTGGEPRYAVASPDEQFVYVSNAGGTRKIGTSIDTTIETYPVWGRNLEISPDGQKLYVANQWNSIYVVNTSTGLIDTMNFVNANSIYAVAISSNNSIGYATDESKDVVYVFNPKTDEPLLDNLNNPIEIAVGFTPRGITAN